MAKLATHETAPTSIPGVTVVTTTVTTPAPEKKSSGKSKADLGVPEDWKIAWPPIAMNPELHAHLTSVAKYRKSQLPEGSKAYGIDQLLLDMVNYAVEAHKDVFAQEAALAPASAPGKSKAPLDFTKMTPEQAEAAVAKEMAYAQKKYDDAQALLQRMREAAAAGAIGTEIPEASDEDGDEGDEE